MDLYQASKIVGSSVHLPGRSDHPLIGEVTRSPGFATASKPLSPAIGLEHGITLRPVEALHKLSYATRPRYHDDLFDMYAQWAMMRYLGFFDLANKGSWLPELVLSTAGCRIVGNQRRVTSEEMGIGFGTLLATAWFEQAVGPGAPISLLDIDAALDDRYVFAAGTRHAVRAIDSRRPDYLLIAQDPSTRRRYRIRLLECKGTRSPGYATHQLAKAVEQLGGVTVGGRIPSGLAVSMITSNDGVSYRAIDPDDNEEASYEVTSNMIEQVSNFRLGDFDRSNVPPNVLVNASVRASWATLADFGGNFGALERWAPAVMRRRLDRRPRNRVSFDTPFGTARGTSITFGFDGARLTLRYAVAEAIDRQISQGVAESVTEAQAAFAEGLPLSQESIQQTDSNELHSATSDGSIFSIDIE